jgi:hypothetical protein
MLPLASIGGATACCACIAAAAKMAKSMTASQTVTLMDQGFLGR